MIAAAVVVVVEEDHGDCNCMGDDCTEQEDELLASTATGLIVRTVQLHNSVGEKKKSGSTVNCTFRLGSAGSSNCSSGQVTRGR